MNKLIPTSLLSLLHLLFMVPDYNLIVADADNDNSKVLYFDFSMQDDYEGLAPLLRYEDKEICLMEDTEGVYKTEEPLCIVSSYSLSWGEGYEISIPYSPLLNDPLYNYTCINTYGSEEAIWGYGAYNKVVPDSGAIASHQRIWLSDDAVPFYENDPWGNPYQNAVAYIDNSGEYEIVMMERVCNSFDSYVYYYCDIPANAFSCRFLKMSNCCVIEDDNEVLFREYGVCYQYVDKGKISTCNVSKADAGILGLVVEAYLTYGKLPSNGSDSETVANLFNTWFKYRSATDTDLKTNRIKDYTGNGYKDGEYRTEAPKTAEFSIMEKWTALCNSAGIDPKTGEKWNGLNFLNFGGHALNIFAVSGVVVAVLSVGALAMLLKNQNRTEE